MHTVSPSSRSVLLPEFEPRALAHCLSRVLLTSPSGSKVDVIPATALCHATTSTWLRVGRQHQLIPAYRPGFSFVPLVFSHQTRRYSCYLDTISIVISLKHGQPPHRRVDPDHRNEQLRVMRHHAEFLLSNGASTQMFEPRGEGLPP